MLLGDTRLYQRYFLFSVKSDTTLLLADVNKIYKMTPAIVQSGYLSRVPPIIFSEKWTHFFGEMDSLFRRKEYPSFLQLVFVHFEILQ